MCRWVVFLFYCACAVYIYEYIDNYLLNIIAKTDEYVDFRFIRLLCVHLSSNLTPYTLPKRNTNRFFWLLFENRLTTLRANVTLATKATYAKWRLTSANDTRHVFTENASIGSVTMTASVIRNGAEKIAR